MLTVAAHSAVMRRPLPSATPWAAPTTAPVTSPDMTSAGVVVPAPVATAARALPAPIPRTVAASQRHPAARPSASHWAPPITAPAMTPASAAVSGPVTEPTVWKASQPPTGKPRNVGAQRRNDIGGSPLEVVVY